MLPALNGASNIYGSGMLSLGMAFSLEQLAIDDDSIAMIRYVAKGIEVSDETLSVDTIHDVGIGNDFLSCIDTLNHLDNPSQPMVFDRRMRPDWEIEGCKDTVDLAHERVINILEKHNPEPLSEYALRRFDEIIAAAEERMRNNLI